MLYMTLQFISGLYLDQLVAHGEVGCLLKMKFTYDLLFCTLHV